MYSIAHRLYLNAFVLRHSLFVSYSHFDLTRTKGFQPKVLSHCIFLFLFAYEIQSWSPLLKVDVVNHSNSHKYFRTQNINVFVFPTENLFCTEWWKWFILPLVLPKINILPDLFTVQPLKFDSNWIHKFGVCLILQYLEKCMLWVNQ